MLRFAVTREPRDRSAVFAMADELDALRGRWRPTAPRFFVTTASEVCDAIPVSGRVVEIGASENANAVIQMHIARIGDPRMRGAFAAAVDFRYQPVKPTEERRQPSTALNRREALDLWRGLPKK
jgi:hypothetical protein